MGVVGCGKDQRGIFEIRLTERAVNNCDFRRKGERFSLRGDQDKLWGSMVKQALKRRRPSFNEASYDFESFSKLLEAAQSRGHLELELDDRSGGYIIRKVIR